MSSKYVTEAALERTFKTFERDAAEGRRASENNTFGVRTEAVAILARRGDIRSEISGYNYRQIFILTGPHAGKATAPNPSRGFVWKVADVNGTRHIRRRADGTISSKFPDTHRQRQQPSAPRLLTEAKENSDDRHQQPSG